jgi:hypothetical protein
VRSAICIIRIHVPDTYLDLGNLKIFWSVAHYEEKDMKDERVQEKIKLHKITCQTNLGGPRNRETVKSHTVT